MDIVRPPLEDFQPITLRLRLAFLGIYIVKAASQKGKQFFIHVSLTRTSADAYGTEYIPIAAMTCDGELERTTVIEKGDLRHL